MEPQRTSPSAPTTPPPASAPPSEPFPGATARPEEGERPAPSLPNGIGAPDSAAPAGETPPPQPAHHAQPPQPEQPWWRFWLRPLLLSAVVCVLLVLTAWDSRRVPTTPAPPSVNTATPPAGSTVSPTSDPALVDMLARLRQALTRRDARALANLADPEGVIVAPFATGLPDTGTNVSDAGRLAQDALSGAQSISILGWRVDGRDRVIVLTDGWPRRTLRPTQSSSIEMSSLAALGLVPRNGTWYWHWLLPDQQGTLAQQARSNVWQDVSQLTGR